MKVEEHEKELTLQAVPAPVESVERSPMSLEQIYRQHHKRVFRVAYRVTGNVQDAEDVLQTVFMRLSRRGADHALHERPESYLHRSAVNAALDILRSRNARHASSLEDLEGTLRERPEAGPDQQQLDREIVRRVRDALSRLSPKAAEVFSLRYFEGYDNHEIAKMVGSSRSTIGVILHRARHQLREALGSAMGEMA